MKSKITFFKVDTMILRACLKSPGSLQMTLSLEPGYLKQVLRKLYSTLFLWALDFFLPQDVENGHGVFGGLTVGLTRYFS